MSDILKIMHWYRAANKKLTGQPAVPLYFLCRIEPPPPLIQSVTFSKNISRKKRISSYFVLVRQIFKFAHYFFSKTHKIPKLTIVLVWYFFSTKKSIC